MSVTLHILMNAYNTESIFSEANVTMLFLFIFSSIPSRTLIRVTVNRGEVAQRISNIVSVKPVGQGSLFHQDPYNSPFPIHNDVCHITGPI